MTDNPTTDDGGPAYKKLAPLVLKRRGNMGLRAAAAEIGISPTTLTRIEKGHVPDIGTLEKLSAWLGEDPSTFTGIGDLQVAHEGMSLRDYFAIHSDQPGVTEIVATAGLTVENNYWVIRPGEDKLSFNDWWGSLSQDERFALYAKVRYTAADAMLAEREGRS